MPPPATPAPTPATPSATSVHVAPPPAGYQWANVGGVIVLQPVSAVAAPAAASASTTAATTTPAAAPAAGGIKMDKISWPGALLIIAAGYLVLAAWSETGPFKKDITAPPPPAQAQSGRLPQAQSGAQRGPHNPQCNPCPSGYGHYGRKPGSPCWCTTQ